MHLAAKVLGLRVLLIDGDENRSSIDWVERTGDTIPVDVAAGSAEQIAALRGGRGYDLAVVDLLVPVRARVPGYSGG